MTYGDYPDLSRVKKILVIKLRQLGDVLLTTPLFSVLKNRFPEAQIDAYIYSESFPLLKSHPGIHQCILYPRDWKKKGLLQKFIHEAKLLRKIRKENYDLVINLTEGDRGAIAAKISGAPVRVGYEAPKKGLLGKIAWYTHLTKRASGLRHTVERNLDTLRRIGIFPSFEERELLLPVAPQALLKMQQQVKSSFFLIHPTSRWLFKCWPKEKMRELTKALLAQGISLAFSSGPDPKEVEMVKEITHGLDVLNFTGKLSLEELIALLSLSEKLICVDSLPFHIASALKKPVVALFGPTSEVTWGPWRNPHATVLTQNLSCRPCYQDGCGGSKRSDCLETLSVERVLEAVSHDHLPLAAILTSGRQEK